MLKGMAIIKQSGEKTITRDGKTYKGIPKEAIDKITQSERERDRKDANEV